MDWNKYTNNRSKAHHLNIQKGLCYMCKREFTPSSLNGKHWSSEDYPHLHHIYDKYDGKVRLKKGKRIVVCTPCHAKLHNYRTGWMIRWKK